MIQLEMAQELGRANNAVLNFFIRKLWIPRIYFDVSWGTQKIDVLAVERDGNGDVHMVRVSSSRPSLTPHDVNDSVLISTSEKIAGLLDDVKYFQGEFRYIALLLPKNSKNHDYKPSSKLVNMVTAKDGIGRIGILLIDVAADDSTVKVLVTPERFRSSKELAANVDKFIDKHEPVYRVRE